MNRPLLAKAPQLVPVTIREDEPGHYSVQQGDRTADGLVWDEMLGQVANLTHPKVRAEQYGMLTAEQRAAEDARRAAHSPLKDRSVRLTLNFAEAENLSSGLSDLLCWARGYVAGNPDAFERHPLGIHEIRELNIALKRAMQEVSSK